MSREFDGGSSQRLIETDASQQNGDGRGAEAPGSAEELATFGPFFDQGDGRGAEGVGRAEGFAIADPWDRDRGNGGGGKGAAKGVAGLQDPLGYAKKASIQRLKLTGAAILVFRASMSLQAAPAASSRSAVKARAAEGVGGLRDRSAVRPAPAGLPAPHRRPQVLRAGVEDVWVTMG